MSTNKHENFPVTRRLVSVGDSLLDARKPLSGYGVEAAAIIAAIVEGAGHVVGVTGRAVGRHLDLNRKSH